MDDLIILYEIGKIGSGPMNGYDPAVLAKCPEHPSKGTCSQPPGSREPLTRVTVHGERTALCHLDRTRVLLSRPSWLCENGEHCKKVPGLDITKLVAVPPWLQKAPFGGVCTLSEVGIPPHRTFASLGFVHLAHKSLGRLKSKKH